MIGQISQLAAEGHLILNISPPKSHVNFTWWLGGSLNKEVIYYDTESVQRRSTGDIAMEDWTSCGFGDGNLF